MAVSQSLTLTESNPVTSANTSKVRILWQSTQTGESWNGYTRTAKYYVSINGGAETEYMVSYTLPQNSTKTIVDTTITVTHKPDGSGTVKVRTWMDTRINAGVVTQEKSLTLSTIPRESSMDALSCSTAYLNGTITYKYTPKSASFYNRCNITLNIGGAETAVKTVTIGQKAASQQTATVTLSESELSTIYTKLPSTKKGTLRFTLRTYSDSGYSTQIGDGENKEITLTIPNISATQPTATLTVTPVSSLPSPFNTLYIKGKTRVTANLTNRAGKYGATITSYNVSIEGKGGTAPYTSGYLNAYGAVSVSGTVTDTRGYSREYTETINVLDYSVPQIVHISGESEVVAARCDSSGNLSESGTYLKIKAKRSYSKVISSGVQKNFCEIRYRYKKEGGSYSSWATILATTAASDEVVTGALLGGALAVESTYEVQVQAADSIGNTATTTITLPTEKVYWHRAGSINAFALGKYAEKRNTFELAPEWDMYYKGHLLEETFLNLGECHAMVQDGDNFNDYTTFGVYSVDNPTAKTLYNCPSSLPGTLIVSSAIGRGGNSGAWIYILQRFLCYDGTCEYYRLIHTNADEKWTYQPWKARSEKAWVNLGFSDKVSVSSYSTIGRDTNGTCSYRVSNENHVYVSFNCAFAYSGEPIKVNGSQIPSPYKPARHIYAICSTSGRAVARIYITPSGDVMIDHVQDVSTASPTTSFNAGWIDGYIDYWV